MVVRNKYTILFRINMNNHIVAIIPKGQLLPLSIRNLLGHNPDIYCPFLHDPSVVLQSREI